ncbi:MAG: Uma2 family endonuclease [Terracidiphilus sp.]|jgi:Uma2 family endonuclease
MATLPNFEPATEFISLREYLATSYRPDCDYVDGRIEERNVGGFDHALLQTLLGQLIMNHRREWGVLALTDVRVQVNATRFRIPDLTVVRSDAPREQILTHPPLMAIEILSPEDRLSRTSERTDEYLNFGIEHVWVLDPARQLAYRVTRSGFELSANKVIAVAGTPIRIELDAIFAELDQAS